MCIWTCNSWIWTPKSWIWNRISWIWTHKSWIWTRNSWIRTRRPRIWTRNWWIWTHTFEFQVVLLSYHLVTGNLQQLITCNSCFTTSPSIKSHFSQYFLVFCFQIMMVIEYYCSEISRLSSEDVEIISSEA